MRVCLTSKKNIIKIKVGENSMIIMYVRHADASGDKLTELGKKQCELMVMQDDGFEFSKIYSSPMKRCEDTSKFLADKYNLEIELCEDLGERKVLKGLPNTDDEKEWFNNYLNPNFSHENPEGCKEFLDRTAKVLDKIIAAHKDKNENVILSAHSCTLYAIMAYFNKSGANKINWYRVSNCAKVFFEIN